MTAVPDLAAAQRIVAYSHHALRTMGFAFRGARHLWESGPDGADRALLAVLEYVLAHEHVDQLFGRVTICSGDGAFADCAARLGGANVDVTVVARKGSLAARLELAARRVVYLTNCGRRQADG